jgi:hypothetical protein
MPHGRCCERRRREEEERRRGQRHAGDEAEEETQGHRCSRHVDSENSATAIFSRRFWLRLVMGSTPNDFL